MNSPKVSIIIPIYNEANHIAKCIQTLKQQSYSNIEIILVDDGSTDNTKEILNNLSSDPNLKIYFQSHLGPGAARNKGVTQSQGDILVFVDADMTFDKDFIKALTLPIVKTQVIGTFSKEEYVMNLDNSWAKTWSQLRGFEEGRMHPKNYPDEQQVFRAITKESFHKAGGFDPKRGYSDDWTLSEKLGLKAINAPGAIFYHYNPASLKEFFMQAKWMAKRPYKFGVVGDLYAILRANFVFSISGSIILVFKYQNLYLFWGKVLYDIATIIGIIEKNLYKNVTR